MIARKSILNSIKYASEWMKYNTQEQIEPPPTFFSNIYYTFQTIYTKIILNPLAKLYMWGPNISGWGFWNGMEYYDICASKTKLNSEFWKYHKEECLELISKNFYSFVVVIQTIVYFGLLYAIIKLIIKSIFCFNYKKKKFKKEKE